MISDIVGNGACVDSAALIGHLNSKGSFSLNTLTVGPGCCLRSGSRLLSGATMAPGSALLEHTLIMVRARLYFSMVLRFLSFFLLPLFLSLSLSLSLSHTHTHTHT